MTQTEIANLALGLIGGKSLTDVTTDTTAQDVSVRKFYDVALKEALSAQPWNFAAKRARLTTTWTAFSLSLIHISEPTRPVCSSRMPSSA